MCYSTNRNECQESNYWNILFHILNQAECVVRSSLPYSFLFLFLPSSNTSSNTSSSSDLCLWGVCTVPWKSSSPSQVIHPVSLNRLSTHLFVHWHPEKSLEISVNNQPDRILVCSNVRRRRRLCQSRVTSRHRFQPLFQPCMYSSLPLDVLFPHDTSVVKEKKRKEKKLEGVTHTENNSAALALSPKSVVWFIFLYLKSSGPI